MPLLAAIFNCIGIYGAQLVGVTMMGIQPGTFWSQMQGAVDLRDVDEGLIKSVVFGAACSLMAVYEGYHAEPTAEGRGSGHHAHRRDLGGTGAAARLHADGGVPVVYGAQRIASWRSQIVPWKSAPACSCCWDSRLWGF